MLAAFQTGSRSSLGMKVKVDRVEGQGEGADRRELLTCYKGDVRDRTFEYRRPEKKARYAVRRLWRSWRFLI